MSNLTKRIKADVSNHKFENSNMLRFEATLFEDIEFRKNNKSAQYGI